MDYNRCTNWQHLNQSADRIGAPLPSSIPPPTLIILVGTLFALWTNAIFIYVRYTNSLRDEIYHPANDDVDIQHRIHKLWIDWLPLRVLVIFGSAVIAGMIYYLSQEMTNMLPATIGRLTSVMPAVVALAFLGCGCLDFIHMRKKLGEEKQGKKNREEEQRKKWGYFPEGI